MELLFLLIPILCLLLAFLPLLQLITVPVEAGRRGHSVGAWFVVTFFWLVVWSPLWVTAWWSGAVGAFVAPIVAGFLTDSPATVALVGLVGFFVALFLMAVSFGPHIMLHAFTKPAQRRSRRRTRGQRIGPAPSSRT